MTKQVVFLVITTLCAAGVSRAVAAPRAFYVAPTGADTNAGTQPRPFATLEKARDAVRAVKRDGGLPSGGVTIWLRGGEYPRSTPLVLAPEDSGTADRPVVYAAYGDERPVVFGGRRITGLRAQGGGVWQTSIPAARDGQWAFRTLYVNGHRYTLARSPNRGYFHMVGGVPDADSSPTGREAGKSRTAFRAPPGALGAWPDLDAINLKVWNRWWTGLLTLRHVDPATGVVELAGPARKPLPTGQATPFIVENHPGALDEPGEWQLDRRSGLLRVIPRPGDDLDKAEVFAPVVEQLVLLAGAPDRGQFVEHVEFRGLTFRASHWTLPPQGYDDTQAAVAAGAMIEATGARDCTWDRCEMTQTDAYAVWLRSGCRHSTLRQCHLHDLGAGGVKLGEAQREDPPRAAGDNRVENCFIHNGGHVHGSGVGVWIGASSDNLVTHNEICDLWYTGVSVGWRWGTALNGTGNNRVTYNHIHHVMQRLDDGGGIYCLGLQPLTVLGNNHIHDVGHDGGHENTRGIYLDEGCAAILVERNVIHDTQGAVVRMQVGTSCNVIVNNICAFGRRFMIDFEVARTNLFLNNIVYWDAGPLFLRDNWPNYEKFLANNVYWRTDGQPILFAGHTWAEWRKLRQTPTGFYKGAAMDAGSVIADPRFVDAARRDFRLRSDSPAFALGFQTIDMEAIGLSGPAAWRSLPSRVRCPIPREDVPQSH